MNIALLLTRTTLLFPRYTSKYKKNYVIFKSRKFKKSENCTKNILKIFKIDFDLKMRLNRFFRFSRLHEMGSILVGPSDRRPLKLLNF